MASAANGALVGVFRSIMCQPTGTSADKWRERGFRHVAVFWAAPGQARTCQCLCMCGATIKAQWCVENLFGNSGEAVAVPAAAPMMTAPVLTLQTECKTLCRLKGKVGCGYGGCRFSICS